MVTETRQPDAQGKARLGDGISELYEGTYYWKP